MRRARYGYALIEMLVIITAVSVIMALSVEPMRALISEIPKADLNYEVWTQTMSMIGQLREDVQAAEVIELNDTLSENAGYQLVLKRGSGTIHYSIGDERTVREYSPADGTEPTVSEWNLPKNKVIVEAWMEQGKPYAIRITTWTQNARARENFVQTFVFFKGAA